MLLMLTFTVVTNPHGNIDINWSLPPLFVQQYQLVVFVGFIEYCVDINRS